MRSTPSAPLSTMQPTFKTRRLLLVPLQEHHLPFEVELDADPDVMKYLEGRPRTAEEVRKVHTLRLALMQDHPKLGFWIGFLGDEPVGLWMLKPPKREDQSGQVEIGYRISSRYWRQGLATEGSQALLKYGFEEMGFDTVCAETMFVNRGSRATMEKLGMKYTRTIHLHFDNPIPGAELGEVEYTITREQWEGGACPTTIT